MAYHLRLLGPVQVMLGTYTNLLTGGVALGRVFEILDVSVEVRESPSAIACANLRGQISFDRVRFRFSNDVPVLEDVSCQIPAGRICAIVGASGSGKSTLADLLLRFYDPDSGAISIDGRDLRDFRLHDLRRQIALVEQTPFLFRATIKENIAYGNPAATLDEIRVCARSAAIDDYIQSLPLGYDTVVGERGCTVSAGERQRIALARALLRSPSVLVMDEPTAALDPSSEAAVARSLSQARHSRTVILVTHRISLVEIADQAFVLENGRIAESGAPRDLLAVGTALSRQFRLVNLPLTETEIV
jgi:ATP-binding cassette subfamily B protein